MHNIIVPGIAVQPIAFWVSFDLKIHSATQCNTVQHTATQQNEVLTDQHSRNDPTIIEACIFKEPIHCNTRCNTLQHTAT